MTTDSLTRTPSGLANQHLLFNVDVVAYCEGGQSHADAVTAAFCGSDQTHDAAFWRTVLASINPERTFHVKSIGSRSTVEDLALLVAQNSMSTVLVCSDSDFDCLLERPRPQPPIFSTWGYSWENDVSDKRVVLCVFRRVRGDSAAAKTALAELADWYDAFFANCEAYTASDAQQVFCGLEGVYDRQTPLRSVGPSLKNQPSLDQDFLNARIVPVLPVALPPLPAILSCQHSFGKFLLRSVYHAIVHFSGKVRKLTLDFDAFVEIVMSCFSDLIRSDPDRRAYYENELTRCGF